VLQAEGADHPLQLVDGFQRYLCVDRVLGRGWEEGGWKGEDLAVGACGIDLECAHAKVEGHDHRRMGCKSRLEKAPGSRKASLAEVGWVRGVGRVRQRVVFLAGRS
jgi:hypothetical protein